MTVYLKHLNDYLSLLEDGTHLDESQRANAHDLRLKLVFDQSKMKPLLGPLLYTRFGKVSSAWNGLQQFNPLYPDPFFICLGRINDALVEKLGESNVDARFEWSIYRITNPLFWVVASFRLAKPLALFAIRSRWSWAAKVIYALAALAAIATFVLTLMRNNS